MLCIVHGVRLTTAHPLGHESQGHGELRIRRAPRPTRRRPESVSTGGSEDQGGRPIGMDDSVRVYVCVCVVGVWNEWVGG